MLHLKCAACINSWDWRTTHVWIFVRPVCTIIVEVTPPSQRNASTVRTLEVTCNSSKFQHIVSWCWQQWEYSHLSASSSSRIPNLVTLAQSFFWFIVQKYKQLTATAGAITSLRRVDATGSNLRPRTSAKAADPTRLLQIGPNLQWQKIR